MFDFFGAYLDKITSPERKRIYLDACKALFEVGISEHEFAIDQEISMVDNGTTEMFLTALDNLLLPMIVQCVYELGVVLEEHVTLEQATDVLRGLNAIENYGDPDTICNLCHSDDGPEAALSDILPLLGRYESADYLTYLSQVSPDTMKRIEDLTRKDVVGEEPSTLQVNRARSRLTPFVQKFTDALVLHALKDGARLGIHISDLITPYRDVIEELSTERAAVELFGFALASDAESLDKVLSEELELLFSDPKKVTPIDVQLAKLKKEFAHA